MKYINIKFINTNEIRIRRTDQFQYSFFFSGNEKIISRKPDILITHFYTNTYFILKIDP